MTKNLPEIPQEEAKKAAADFLGLKAGDFKQAYESSGGPLPTWDFGTDTVYIGVTKRGGYPVYMRKYRDVKEQPLTPEEAVAAAKDYLDAKNFKG
jgi:hypothetical protein